ncbi:MAG TPA: SDR family NAD(P)-dependent oxidoreductase [Pirellulales bacterium]|jgi:short-subunit dehydrogenase|nr:SDR family NAD(P)-dependent oxidoreductase [Pirellulales bacterium]
MATRSIEGCRGILTGASSGIGRALVVELVRRGARLVIVARRRERLDELAGSLADASGRVEVLAGDVTLSEVRQAAVDLATSAFGGLDLLINNAGGGAMGRFAEASAERLRQVMELNFFAPAELIRAALPLLKAGRKPMVVNVGSILGHRGIPGCAEYCASKFALQGLSESLRAEFARLGIDLLVVSPARTQTEFFQQAIDAGKTPWSRIRGVSPQVVARRTATAIGRGRHEIVISPSGKLVVWMNRLMPRVMDAILARYA